VTYPLKTAVLARVDSASDAAAAIGAVNTLDLRDGRAMGHNTDARGAARALQVLGGVSPAGRTVLVIGGGGAARAAAYGLLEAGAERIVFAVRDTARVAPPVGRLRIAFPKSGIDIRTMNDMRAEEFDIVVNATPVGMNDAGVEQLVDEASVTPSQCYFDFVYHPRRTPFLDTARRLGARTVDGLALLVAQAEEAFHIWTGFHFSLPDMYEAVAGSHEGNPLETRE
jgi:shikimate dehydrogenase